MNNGKVYFSLRAKDELLIVKSTVTQEGNEVKNIP